MIDEQIVGCLQAFLVGALASIIYTWPYHYMQQWFARAVLQHSRQSVILLGFFSGAKIILLALFFYYVLQHTVVNSILFLVGFFCVTLLSIQKAVRHGGS